MDELELLKKDWGKQDSTYKQLSTNDIYPMLQKKSSSIVKTLFYISIGELVFWILINTIPYFSSDSYREKLDAVYSNDTILVGLTIISYPVILLFIYLLFKSHKAISVTDNAKKLMESILKTRRVIKYYVIYNLVMAFVSMVVGLYFSIIHNPKLSETISHFNQKQLMMTYAIMIGCVAVFVVIIWLFYKLLYGLLLKRLNRNYKELKKLEV
jgi:magnesium-transporting ATPase (P-type)